MNNWSFSKAMKALLFTVILLLFLTVTLINLTPPISRDALVHHLAIPKLWIKNGGFYEMPWAPFSYYPMNIDLLYLGCLYLKNETATKFVHFAFALATALLIFIYLKKRTMHWVHWKDYLSAVESDFLY